MNDVMILEAAIKIMNRALNDLVIACLDERGQAKMPAVSAIMKARGFLPPSEEMSFGLKEVNNGQHSRD